MGLLIMSTHSGECNSTCEHSIVLLPLRPAGGCNICVCVQCTTLRCRAFCDIVLLLFEQSDGLQAELWVIDCLGLL